MSAGLRLAKSKGKELGAVPLWFLHKWPHSEPQHPGGYARSCIHVSYSAGGPLNADERSDFALLARARVP